MIWERLISWSKTMGAPDVSDDARRWANATLHDAERIILSPGGWKEIIALSFEAGRMWERTRKPCTAERSESEALVSPPERAERAQSEAVVSQ